MSMSTVALAAENTNGVVNITMSYELQSVNRFINALDTAKIAVRVENISGHDLTGVTVAADSDRLYLKKGETGKLEIGTLKADDSAEYSFKAMIRPNDKSLTFSGWGSDLIDLSDGKYTLKSGDGPIVKFYGTYSNKDNPITVSLVLDDKGETRTFWEIHADSGDTFDLPVYGSIDSWTCTDEGVNINGDKLSLGENAPATVTLTATVGARLRHIIYEMFTSGYDYGIVGKNGEYAYNSKVERDVAVGEKEYLAEVSYNPDERTFTGWLTAANIEILEDDGGYYFEIPTPPNQQADPFVEVNLVEE